MDERKFKENVKKLREFQKHLEEFKSENYLIYNTLLDEKDWGNELIAEEYLRKYWLESNEYLEVREKIQFKIFNSNFQILPEPVFLTEFQLIPNIGGVLFDEQEFKALKKCFDKTGDKFFYIIQNDFGNDEILTFRLKFPVTITWSELISGNYISTVLFEMFHNDYFVFGDSLLWGKYCANDEKLPINIYGVTSSELSLFLTNFKDSRVINPNSVLPDPNFPNLEVYCSTLSEVIDSLPDSYKDIYKIY